MYNLRHCGANLKKPSTLKFMMITSFVPSNFIEQKYTFFVNGKFFCVIFDFHFHENPRFRNEFQALKDETHVCYYEGVGTLIIINTCMLL